VQKALKVRADGGENIGLGHWSRCLFLLNCINGVTKQLYTYNAKEYQEAFGTLPGLDLITLTSEKDFIESIVPADIVILDGYHFDADYLHALKGKKAIVVYVDDRTDPELVVDVLINHSEGVRAGDYKRAAPYASFYLGGHFSMVFPIFRASTVEVKFRLQHLLISMGGTDPFNYLQKILDELAPFTEVFKTIQVIVGKHYRSLNETQQSVKHWKNVNFYQGISKNQVAEMMTKAGVAIVPASTMAIEYAHVRGILAIVQTAGNQENLYRGLIKSGVAISLKDFLSQHFDLLRLSEQIQEKQASVFDGLSESRFKKLFLELQIQSEMKFRKACMNDKMLTFNWAADDELRAFSFSKYKISMTTHIAWFEKKINDKNCFFYITEIDHKPIGFIRFDINDKEAVISYLIDKSSHGHGIGRLLLSMGIKKFFEEEPRIQVLTGYVMTTNTASIRIFERLGFSREVVTISSIDAMKFYKKIYE
jgi:UDP-2,4-diacetamido-2,4,6-trideoxy-beta-L-altropyranose hydrolase